MAQERKRARMFMSDGRTSVLRHILTKQLDHYTSFLLHENSSYVEHLAFLGLISAPSGGFRYLDENEVEDGTESMYIIRSFLKVPLALRKKPLLVEYHVDMDINNLVQMNQLEDISLYVPPGENISMLSSGFLARMRSLKHVRFISMQTVTSIGFQFLYGCTMLQTVDFSGLTSVFSVGCNWMKNCSSLTSVVLSLDKLLYIGNNCMEGCIGLKSVTWGTERLVNVAWRRPEGVQLSWPGQPGKCRKRLLVRVPSRQGRFQRNAKNKKNRHRVPARLYIPATGHI